MGFSYSTSGGTSWLPCTPLGAGATPALGVTVPATGAQFTWDAHADGVGLAGPQNTLVRVETTGLMITNPYVCESGLFVIHDPLVCVGLCGDCDQSGTGPDILDALLAAQIAAAVALPPPAGGGCCDVTGSLSVDVLDALLIAQESAGIQPTLACP